MATEKPITLMIARQMIERAGLTFDVLRSYESDEWICGFSFETDRACFGDARMTVSYYKPAGVLRVVK